MDRAFRKAVDAARYLRAQFETAEKAFEQTAARWAELHIPEPPGTVRITARGGDAVHTIYPPSGAAIAHRLKIAVAVLNSYVRLGQPVPTTTAEVLAKSIELVCATLPDLSSAGMAAILISARVRAGHDLSVADTKSVMQRIMVTVDHLTWRQGDAQ